MTPIKISPYTQLLAANKPINLKAFLSTIKVSEGTFGDGDDGYNVLVGGHLFDSYDDHPRILVDVRDKEGNIIERSTAAGAFQVLEHNFDIYKPQLGLPDFGHDSQDAIAVQMLKETGSYALILSGNITAAIVAASSRWASFPNVSGASAYGQPVQKMNTLVLAFQRFGGIVKV